MDMYCKRLLKFVNEQAPYTKWGLEVRFAAEQVVAGYEKAQVYESMEKLVQGAQTVKRRVSVPAPDWWEEQS